MNYPRRRKSDQTFWGTLRHVIVQGDASVAILCAGLSMLSWAALGLFDHLVRNVPLSYQFFVGNAEFWLGNYVVTGSAMVYLVGAGLPAMQSLLVGAWVFAAWTWYGCVLTMAYAAASTDVMSAGFIAAMGLFIVQRSAKP